VTDLSEAGDRSIRVAHHLAKKHEARISFLHVVPIPDTARVLFPQLNERMALQRGQLVPEAGGKLNERIVHLTGRGTGDFQAVVEAGVTDAVVIDQAEQNAVDLVVIPSGRNLERVVRYVHCAVLVARSEYGGGEILGATDFSDPSLPAIAAAAEESRLNDQPLTVLFSLDFSAYPIVGADVPPTFGLTDNELSEMAENARTHLADALLKVKAKGDILVPFGPPALTILSAAQDKKCSFVVVGSKGRTGLRRLLLGSVAEAVAQNAVCSVLVMRLAS
jgi:nucleotide-binding universal stress UspA family protein